MFGVGFGVGIMPGDNCSVFGCGTCRRRTGVSIFKVPGIKQKQWRKRFLEAIQNTRVVDDDFKKMVQNDRVFACERHFKNTEIKTRKP